MCQHYKIIETYDILTKSRLFEQCYQKSRQVIKSLLGDEQSTFHSAE